MPGIFPIMRHKDVARGLPIFLKRIINAELACHDELYEGILRFCHYSKAELTCVELQLGSYDLPPKSYLPRFRGLTCYICRIWGCI